MSTISVQEMAQDPLGCLKRVEAGETLIVVRDDQPIAEIKPPPDPFDEPLPYGQRPAFIAPEDVGKVTTKPRWTTLLASLAAQKIWVEVDNVCAYLDHFPDVADALVAIAQSTRKEFGPDTKLTLEINRDPEIDDKYLRICVIQAEYDPDAIERIRAIADAHADQLWDKKGHILLMPDYARIQ